VTFNMAKLNLESPAVAGVSIASKLTIQMHIPQQESARPSVKFLKQGALTNDELSVFSAALRAANKVTSLADATPAPAPPPPVSPCHALICPAHHQGLLAMLLHSHLQWLLLPFDIISCRSVQSLSALHVVRRTVICRLLSCFTSTSLCCQAHASSHSPAFCEPAWFISKLWQARCCTTAQL